MKIDVAADVSASPAQLKALDAAFLGAGFVVESAAVIERRSGGPLPWVVYVTIGAPIASFFTAFASEAAKDTYPAFKRWVKELWAARSDSGPRGTVEVRDSDHTNVVLSNHLPDEALDALRHIAGTRRAAITSSGARRPASGSIPPSAGQRLETARVARVGR